MKEKTKDRLKSWCMTLGFAFAIGLCAFATSCDQKVQKTSAYSVNQHQDSVTFTKEELNNCSYTYLTYSIANEYDLSDSYIIYNNDTFVYDDLNNTKLAYRLVNTDYFIEFYFIDVNDYEISAYTFNYFNWDTEIKESFEYSLTIYSDFFAENMQKSITLTASQLNNNTYEYFSNYSDDGNSNNFSKGYLIYNNNLYLYSQYLENDCVDYIYEISETEFYIIRFTFSSNKFTHLYTNESLSIDNENIGFSNSITIYSTYIHDNLFSPDQYQNNFGNALTDFIQIITSGLVNFARGVANGIMGMASALFFDTGSLSVFGGIVAIFAGLALAVGITTRVYSWVTSLGN